MTVNCIHPAGHVPPFQNVSASEWNDRLIDFMAVIEDFNVRGQRDQINHPGFITEFHFCPNCGAKIDRSALGLMTYAQAFQAHADSKDSK